MVLDCKRRGGLYRSKQNDIRNTILAQFATDRNDIVRTDASGTGLGIT